MRTRGDGLCMLTASEVVHFRMSRLGTLSASHPLVFFSVMYTLSYYSLLFVFDIRASVSSKHGHIQALFLCSFRRTSLTPHLGFDQYSLCFYELPSLGGLLSYVIRIQDVLNVMSRSVVHGCEPP